MIPGVPYDAEIEYLESTGTQWIDTGVILDSTCSVMLDYQLTATDQSRAGLFGGFFPGLYRFGSVISPSSSNKVECGYGTGNAYYQYANQDLARHVVEQQTNKYYVDGVLVYSFPAATFTVNTSAPLLNFDYTNYVAAKARCFSSRWWKGGTLIRDFIPVRVGQTGYMYDRVSRKLFGNKGTGAFVLGPDVATPVMGLRGMFVMPSVKEYVQDGLIAMWDAVENAGIGTHDPGATVWKDLIGSRDLTCSNVSWKRNWATFAGNGYALHNIVEDEDMLFAENRTLEACFRSSSNINGMDVASITYRDGDFWQMYPFRLRIHGSSNRIIVANGRNISPRPMYNRDNAKIAGGTTFSVTAYRSGVVGAYWDGTPAVQNGSDYEVHAISGEVIGASSTTNFRYTGDVGCVRCYNRVLSQAEIAHNYSIDKARFNLP